MQHFFHDDPRDCENGPHVRSQARPVKQRRLRVGLWMRQVVGVYH